MQNGEKSAALSTAEKALPSSDRLLKGIQATLQKIGKLVTDEQSLMELNMIDMTLSELARRNQLDFYIEYYEGLRKVLIEGIDLLGAKLAAGDAETMQRSLASTLPPRLSLPTNYELANAAINEVMRHLATLVKVVHEETPATTAYLQRVAHKEGEFHEHRMKFAAGRKFNAADGVLHFTRETLEQYLQQKFPERHGLKVTNFRQLVGGYQKITVLFETEDDSGEHQSLVLRSEKPDKFVSLHASDIRKEYEIVKFVFDAGVKVAEPLWLESDKTKLGERFFVSTKVPGENLGNAVVANKEVTDEIARSFIEAIARVHMLPRSAEMRQLSVGEWLDLPTAQDVAREAVLLWRNQPWMKSGNPSAVLDRVTTWLIDNVPTDDYQACLIHMDYGLHNVLVHDSKVSAILDWESARIGDPAEDISWFIQFSGGKVDYKKALDWYEEFTGNRISEYRLRYHDVWSSLKVLMSCISAESMYETTDEASIIWLIMPLSFAIHATSIAEERIRIAESVKGR